MAFLTVRVKGTEGYTRHDLGKDRTVVGRASACDLSVQGQNISREHCLIVRKEGNWWVEDMGSSNGTYVNKEKISAPKQLNEKDIIKAGAIRLTFHGGDISQVEAIDIHSDRAHSEHDDASEQATADGLEAALSCPACSLWVSVAHRQRGDQAICPRCTGKVAV